MKLLYVSNHRFPTEKAHGLQIAKTVEALMEAEAAVTVWVPRRKQTSSVTTEDPQVFYRLKQPLHIKRFFCIDFLTSRWVPRFLAFLIQSWTFACSVRRALSELNSGVIYTRTLLPFWAYKKRAWIYEAHTFPKTRWGQWFESRILKNSSGMICISEGLGKKYRTILPTSIPVEVVHDGVDLEQFSSLPDAETARKVLGISDQRPIVLYTGSPFPWKGVLTLAEATRALHEIHMIFVGGYEKDPYFLQLKQWARHASVLPYVNHEKIPYFLAAADILVIPNSAKDSISAEDSSPLKLFEAMATGKKIVASRVPALTGILDEKSAWFFEPDQAQDLQMTLSVTLKSHEKRGEEARKKVEEYSWGNRAKRILDFIGTEKN